ncbi:SMP-30/gluconolactonase/LRE family protein [Nocardioides sambongensis]|uniref:SMP-30/gluconolactonase/LRE family protein n=1 Tax=Nocardioides sambongensis TaxID=2589074 RepID=UPI001125C6B5|nr:SMP-30/gluconolactonase/LRE family protein [Nocardioides sambongensis]
MTFTVIPVPGDGAEDVLVARSGPYAGSVYTGTADGSVYRVAPDGSRIDRVGHTGGRPLGIEEGPDGRLLVCDAHRGLLRLDPADGSVEEVVASSGAAGTELTFCNNAAIAADGTIFFSDSSTRYGIERWKDDFLQVTRTGRLIRVDPDGSRRTVLDGLAFANGVALAADDSYVCVAETSTRTVVRLWLTGPSAGMRDRLCSGLPGYPDNISRGSDGLIWVTIASPLDPVVERLQRGPMLLRKAATRLPEALQPKPQRTVRAQAFDDKGRLVHDVDITPDAHGASYHMATGVREHDGVVWFGSLHEPAVARYDL